MSNIIAITLQASSVYCPSLLSAVSSPYLILTISENNITLLFLYWFAGDVKYRKKLTDDLCNNSFICTCNQDGLQQWNNKNRPSNFRRQGQIKWRKLLLKIVIGLAIIAKYNIPTGTPLAYDYGDRRPAAIRNKRKTFHQFLLYYSSHPNPSNET